jgi:hypothetical protein
VLVLRGRIGTQPQRGVGGCIVSLTHSYQTVV